MRSIDLVALAFVTALLVFPSLKLQIAQRLRDCWSPLAKAHSQLQMPYSPRVDLLFLSVGTIAFFVSRMRSVKKHKLTQRENLAFLISAAIGIIGGLLVED